MVAQNQVLDTLGYFELIFSIGGLWAITARKQWKDFWSLGALLAVHSFTVCILIPLIALAGHRLDPHITYPIYFYAYWIGFALESVLGLAVIYCVFRLAMAPLRGLQNLGMLIFRWAGAISVAVALGSAFTPHQSGIKYMIAAISQLQRTQSILTLCLLLFVCFAIRPMGLSYASRIFGVSLGLGITAANDLVQSALFPSRAQMTSTADFLNGAVFCTAAFLWMAYFALPEPQRRIILLPTTSPFLRWNQISEALGDSPGFVAISGGIESFAPSEIEILRRASSNVTQFPKSLGA
ncbi:MAG: hypothetical protein NVSMB62_04760 [Acidobacteriaceae bacterium]